MSRSSRGMKHHCEGSMPGRQDQKPSRQQMLEEGQTDVLDGTGDSNSALCALVYCRFGNVILLVVLYADFSLLKDRSLCWHCCSSADETDQNCALLD